MQRAVDRNRLDRIPTPGERVVGIILSALIAAIFLVALVLSLLALSRSALSQSGVLVATAVSGVLAATGMFLFYRITFTRPRALSHRANHIFAKIFVGVTVLMVLLFFANPTSASHRLMAIGLLCGALGNLEMARRAQPRSHDK